MRRHRKLDGDPEADDRDIGHETQALGRACDHLIDARHETDRANARSLKIFVDMALVEAGNLLAQAGMRRKNNG